MRRSLTPLPVSLILLLVTLAPLASAEFGLESPDGFPIGVDGTVHRPPVAPAGHAHVHDAQEEGPLNKLGPLTVYPYYPLLTLELQRLAREHPDLVKLTSAGKSTAGLDLWLLEIADFKNPNMRPLEEREVVYIDGGTHSNEYSGVYFVTEIAQFLLDEYETNETAKWIVENRHTFILPMVNPDGSNAFGRLNAKTVNINRNFPATWGTVNEMPVVNNPGPAPGSEPETQIVMALLDRLQPDYVNSIHCCGNLWLHPWGAEDIPAAPDTQMYTRICDEAFMAVREFCGPIWSTIYPASGTTADEGYGRVGASSWTYEMSGRGKVAGWGQPAIANDVRVQEVESWGGILHAFLHVEKYGAHPRLLALEGDAGSLVATVENAGYGNLTAGNLTVGGQVLALPALAPGERATLRFDGAFSEGSLVVRLDWQKRILHAPQGLRTLDVALVEEGGRLVGVIPDLVAPLAIEPDAPQAQASVPGPAVGLAVLALAGIALLRRRRA